MAGARRYDFPDRLRGEEVAGVDMVMLDADIAGRQSGWLHSPVDLDSDSLRMLRARQRELEQVLPELSDVREVAYFTRVRSMTLIVLRAHGA